VRDREWLSIGLWIVALAIWLIVGLTGSLPWWVILVVTLGFGLQVVRAVRLARARAKSEH
jgi:F0F1-type ATP synthase assembly protein I